MLRLLFNEFEEAFGKLTGDDRVEELSVATAKLAYPYIDRMARRMQEKYPGLKESIRIVSEMISLVRGSRYPG